MAAFLLPPSLSSTLSPHKPSPSNLQPSLKALARLMAGFLPWEEAQPKNGGGVKSLGSLSLSPPKANWKE